MKLSLNFTLLCGGMGVKWYITEKSFWFSIHWRSVLKTIHHAVIVVLLLSEKGTLHLICTINHKTYDWEQKWIFTQYNFDNRQKENNRIVAMELTRNCTGDWFPHIYCQSTQIQNEYRVIIWNMIYTNIDTKLASYFTVSVVFNTYKRCMLSV